MKDPSFDIDRMLYKLEHYSHLFVKGKCKTVEYKRSLEDIYNKANSDGPRKYKKAANIGAEES